MMLWRVWQKNNLVYIKIDGKSGEDISINEIPPDSAMQIGLALVARAFEAKV